MCVMPNLIDRMISNSVSRTNIISKIGVENQNCLLLLKFKKSLDLLILRRPANFVFIINSY